MTIKIFGTNYNDYKIYIDYKFINSLHENFYFYTNKEYFCKGYKGWTFLKSNEDCPKVGANIFDTGKSLTENMLKGKFKLSESLQSADCLVFSHPFYSNILEVKLYIDDYYKRLIIAPEGYNSRGVIGENWRCITVNYKELTLIGTETLFVINPPDCDKEALEYIGIKPIYNCDKILEFAETPEHDLTLDLALQIYDLTNSSDLSVYLLGVNLLLTTNIFKFKASTKFLILQNERRIFRESLPFIPESIIGGVFSKTIKVEDWNILKVLAEKSGWTFEHMIERNDLFKFINNNGTINYE